MKIITIGDIHGRNFWTNILEEPMDRLVFIGDYFDSYNQEITAEQEIANFNKIVGIKRDEPGMVTLLIGNHDFHYLKGVPDEYSRYQSDHAKEISAALEVALDVMQVCYVHNNMVFTHAGITKTWCSNHQIDLNNLENSVNQKFKEDRNAFGFIYGIGDDDGSDKRQSPIWVRPNVLVEDKIDGYQQIVGHTQQKTHRIQDGIAFIDVPGNVFIMENANEIL